MLRGIVSLPDIGRHKQEPGRAKHHWRISPAVAVGACTLITATILVGTPGTALAYEYVCGTQGTGYSWGVLPGAGNEVAATKFTKQPPGCLDFNLILYETDSGGNDTQGLEGLYKSGSTWIAGSRGYVKGIPDATNGDWVLISDVATGTLMKVWSGGQDFIVVDY